MGLAREGKVADRALRVAGRGAQLRSSLVTGQPRKKVQGGNRCSDLQNMKPVFPMPGLVLMISVGCIITFDVHHAARYGLP